ncbi:MAG: 30S ribosomal protein S6 [Acidobacteria bacterium]|nr:30S ribosomal protein S6 [Acidobacteriota bacterium]
MRIYEELYIARPNATDEEIDALNAQLENVIKQAGGTLDKTDKWGVRRLAYRVAKNSDGFYVLLSFHCGPQTVREIERRLRVTDLVIKYLTVRMDEKLKWLEKRKKAREKRAARKPAAPAPQASPAVPGAAPGVPGAPAEAAPVPGAPEAKTN